MLDDPCQSFVHHNIIFRMSFAKIRPSRAREKYKGLENLFGGYPSWLENEFRFLIGSLSFCFHGNFFFKNQFDFLSEKNHFLDTF